jgi:hypothetical protein
MLISTEYKNEYIDGLEIKSIVKFLKDYFGNSEIMGAEVGVFRGINAKNLLDNLNFKTIYLVDPYQPYNDFDNTQSLIDARQIALDTMLGYPNQIEWLYEKSLDAVTKMPPLDFAYLDNSHRYLDVLTEIPKWYDKLKLGGLLCGDDFVKSGSYKDMEVSGAVCDVGLRTGIDIFLSNDKLADWWLIKKQERLNLYG